MNTNRNPQQAQMAHESMVRNLAAQAEAVWPQERELFARYSLPGGAAIMDLACGTGEITRRLAGMFPGARVTGIDIEDGHLNTARKLSDSFGERVTFEKGDAFELAYDDAHFDLSVCRHVLQAVPDAQQVVKEMLRVTKPGGVLHIVAEDYAMMHFHPTRLDNDEFWRLGPIAFAAKTGSDLLSGRKVFTWLRELGLKPRVDYIIVDTVRVPRETYARIWEAWRDGYTDIIAENTTLTRQQVADHWQDMLECIRNPKGYAVWHLPVISASA